MSKNNVGSLVLVLGVASCVWSCSRSGLKTGARSTGGADGTTGGASATGETTAAGGASGAGGASAIGGASAMAGGTLATGGTSATGGAPAAGSSATSGGASSTGGASAVGGATGTSAMTLAEACTNNCALASGLPACSTTIAECERNCMTTYDNTYAVYSDLGRQYTEMMICIATNFTSSDQFSCAKPNAPNSPLNKWSPGPGSSCEDYICGWACDDLGTLGQDDPWVILRCGCGAP